MRRWSLVLALAVMAASTSAGAAGTAPQERLLIPYLSGGAGVYVDEDGRPVTSEGAPRVPGIHVRPPVTRPEPPQPRAATAAGAGPRRAVHANDTDPNPGAPARRVSAAGARRRRGRSRRHVGVLPHRRGLAELPAPRERHRLLDLGRFGDHDAHLALRRDRAGEDRDGGVRQGPIRARPRGCSRDRPRRRVRGGQARRSRRWARSAPGWAGVSPSGTTRAVT